MEQHAIDSILGANLASLRARIDARCRACGRDPAGVLLLPATKYAGIAVLRALAGLGVRAFGENQVLDAERKAAALAPGIEFHMIGHLQRNKVARALRLFRAIHSVDSLRLAEELDRRAAGCSVRALIEVNVGGDERKCGFAPGDAIPAMEAMRAFPSLRIEGFMTVPPFETDPARVRPFFRALARLGDEARRRGLGDGRLATLSMGMSNDFETAIEEGATIVRIGSALFAGLDAEALAG
ncbi:MAG TPA: YggS family pyridoxal phosphate-dependent enzyme [Planctomycetes bacterium]|nr:YggS family pyridoxal phosphate-dependent enzyme [Planctomycetota bacterium]